MRALGTDVPCCWLKLQSCVCVRACVLKSASESNFKTINSTLEWWLKSGHSNLIKTQSLCSYLYFAPHIMNDLPSTICQSPPLPPPRKAIQGSCDCCWSRAHWMIQSTNCLIWVCVLSAWITTLSLSSPFGTMGNANPQLEKPSLNNHARRL